MSLSSRRNIGYAKAAMPRLRITRRFVPMATILPLMRVVSTAFLIIAVIIGAYRFLLYPRASQALEFTSHVVGTETGAVGVLGLGATDTDRDNDIDIVTAGSDGVKVYIQTSEGKFEEKKIDDAKGDRIQVVDLDVDGDQDLLVSLKEGTGVKWYSNNGENEFQGFIIGTGSSPAAYAGDINGDGAPDIAIAADETSSGEKVLRRWMNDGSGLFTSTVLDTDSKVTAVTIGDINGNGYRDIVTGGENGLQNWDTSDGFTWSRNDIDSGNQNGTHIVVGDVNGDGGTDIVTGDQSKNAVAYYRHLQHSSFERIHLEGDADATTVQIIDLDEDGDEDVVAAGQDDNTIYWFDNDGSEEFTQQTLATNLQSVFSALVVDIDSDNDFDFVGADHFRGTIFWYERTQAKPVATKPTNIRQSTDASGRLTFETEISDSDKDLTRVRVQYSFDGTTWHKPWITAVKTNTGSVDLKNSNGYQVGTVNPIDTNASDTVTVTFTWDTKSVENTGGPIAGDVGTIQLRVIPRDNTGNGLAAVSSQFRIDNSPPQNVAGLRIDEINESEATLSWNPPTDSSSVTYELYYGTNNAAVLDQTSEVWDATDDEAMGDTENTTTTITGLEGNKAYTFKLSVEDKYGNSAASPSVQGTTVTTSTTPSTPTTTPTTSPPAGTQPTPTPTSGVTQPTPSVSPPINQVTTTPSPIVTVTPTATIPPTTLNNIAPTADAGLDQVVNPSALVILDGTASFDADRDSLTYSWRQLSGPETELLSDRTATPSFSAGGENETYIFAVTVRDTSGASATDTVTIATKALPATQTTEVDVQEESVPDQVVPDETSPLITILKPIDILLFIFALLSTAISVFERMARSFADRKSKGVAVAAKFGTQTPKGKVVHFKTGEPIAGVQVLIYGSDGKLRRTERTSDKGEFATLFPAGEYTIGVKAQGFTFAPAASRAIQPEGGLLYTGGRISVQDSNKPLSIVVPMKPTREEIASTRVQFLHTWQVFQRIGRVLSWPIFITGSLINTALIFWVPGALFLVIELLYVLLVIVKVALEVRVRPAYGLVRDAITHVPLDLAVVRLYEQGTNRLIMTRVTNAQGKFFALPPSGKYMVTVTKPGYATFSKENVVITSEQDSVLQITTDLMPVAPSGGLQAARAAVL